MSDLLAYLAKNSFLANLVGAATGIAIITTGILAYGALRPRTRNAWAWNNFLAFCLLLGASTICANIAEFAAPLGHTDATGYYATCLRLAVLAGAASMAPLLLFSLWLSPTPDPAAQRRRAIMSWTFLGASAVLVAVLVADRASIVAGASFTAPYLSPVTGPLYRPLVALFLQVAPVAAAGIVWHKLRGADRQTVPTLAWTLLAFTAYAGSQALRFIDSALRAKTVPDFTSLDEASFWVASGLALLFIVALAAWLWLSAASGSLRAWTGFRIWIEWLVFALTIDMIAAFIQSSVSKDWAPAISAPARLMLVLFACFALHNHFHAAPFSMPEEKRRFIQVGALVSALGVAGLAAWVAPGSWLWKLAWGTTTGLLFGVIPSLLLLNFLPLKRWFGISQTTLPDALAASR